MPGKRKHHRDSETSDSETSSPTTVLPFQGRRIEVDEDQDNMNDSAVVSNKRLKRAPNIRHPVIPISSSQSSRKRRLPEAEETTVPTKRLKLQASRSTQEVVPARCKRNRTQSHGIVNALSETAHDLLMAMTRLTNAIERLCFLLTTNLVSKVVKDVCAAVAKCMQGVEVLQTLLPNQDTIPATFERFRNITDSSVTSHKRKRPRKSKQSPLSLGSQHSSRIQSTAHVAEIWGAAEDQLLRALTPNVLADGTRLQERFGFDILVEKIHDMLFENELA
ncbi:hypothetical protein BDZ89DRAFT_1163685 [Hymenopellis radicata]|nr:hypothetical protein BDZ89DRAFT_1163685 [Hymenopellis radicata]